KSIRQIADTIAEQYPKWSPSNGGGVTIQHLENPRVEAEDHYYNVKHTALVVLGLKPTLLSTTLIDHLLDVVERYRDRVDLASIMPTVSWRETTSELPGRTSELAKT